MDANLKHPQTPYTTRVVFVAGAGAVGSAVAEQYLKDGWKVCVVSKSGSNKIAGALNLKADLEDHHQTITAVDECVKQYGAITIAVCAAGSYPAHKGISTSREMLTRHVCNLELNFARAIAPLLRQKREGAMVFFTSSLTLMCIDSPGMTEFLAWTNGLSGMVDGLTTELRQAHVRVSAIILGFVAGSKFSRATRDGFGTKAVNPELANEAKWVPPTDVAKSVKFLTEPANLNGSIWELEVTPQIMLDKNGLFTDAKRVEEMLAKLDGPAFRDNKVALITGSGKGIGRGVALEMCRAGYHIAALTRTAADLDSLEIECKGINPRCEVMKIPVDVTNEKALEEAVRKTVEKFGTVTVVVSNAGTNRRRVAALADMKTWRDVMDVDLLAAMNLTRLSLPFLIRHAKLTKLPEKPIVAFVSTRYAHHRGARMPGISPYITAKAGTNAFAKIVLEEVRDFGVGVLGETG